MALYLTIVTFTLSNRNFIFYTMTSRYNWHCDLIFYFELYLTINFFFFFEAETYNSFHKIHLHVLF